MRLFECRCRIARCGGAGLEIDEEGASLLRQPIRCVKLDARWGAASPAMRGGEKRRESFAEDDKMNTDERRHRGERSHAVHELAGMRDFLAKRTIRGVFIDWIFVARRTRSVVSRLNRGTGDKSLCQGGDAHGLWQAGCLRNMDVGLNDQDLDRQSQKSQQQEKYARVRCRARDNSARILARNSPSRVAVLHHPPPDFRRG